MKRYYVPTNLISFSSIEVSRAFQVLSDPEKKSKYDRFGGDPDNRFGAGAGPSSPFSNFARSASAGNTGGSSMFEEEISPEELFRQFFGGGMGGPGGGLFGGPFGMTKYPPVKSDLIEHRTDRKYRSGL